MRVAIVGAGNVGTYIAGDLRKARHEVLVIERNAQQIESASDGIDGADGIEWLAADACEVSTLQQAKVDTCDVLVAATGDDKANLVVSLLAKQEFAVPRVIARVNNPDNYWLFNETWGVDVAVSTPHVLTGLVEEATTVGSLVQLLKLRGGDVHLVEVTLATDSPANGRHVAELGLPHDATIVAVLRRDHVQAVNGDTVLYAGDEVVLLITPDVEAEVHRLLVSAE